MVLDLSEYPRFSLQERERRWRRVRELMRDARCDCLVAPGLRDPEEQTTARYLSQIGGIGVNAWVVFPLNGEPTAIVDSDRNGEFVRRTQDWITDVRVGPETELVPKRLRELELEGARIGLTQFRGHYRAPEGNIPYDVVRQLQEALPRADLYPENDVLAQARLVKSAEEIAVIQKVNAANEAAIRVLCETARPDVRQEEVWYAMADVLTRAGGQWPARLSVTFGGPANTTLGMPIPDRIPAGSLCSQEICARIQGYRAQCNHTVQAGGGGPPDYEAVMRATIEVWNEMLAWLRPGRTVGELCEQYMSLCRARGADDSSGVVVHTNGLGNDFPRCGPRLMRENERGVVLAPGHTFTMKLALRYPTGTSTQYGESVTITETGARRLGKRAQEPLIVGR